MPDHIFAQLDLIGHLIGHSQVLGRLTACCHNLLLDTPGYLLMLRDGDLGSGEGGLAGGVGGNVGAGGVTGEWSERFFFLSGHFLRYKKHSLNLTSVNLKQVT